MKAAGVAAPGSAIHPAANATVSAGALSPEHTTGWWRVQDPRKRPSLNGWFSSGLPGKGSRDSRELNERGIPAPRGGKWNATTVSKILTSPMLLGHVVVMKGETGVKGMPGYKKGQVVATRRGKDGQPIMFTDEPLIDQETWDELQEAIKAGSRARGQAQSRHMLYRVLFCRYLLPRAPACSVNVRFCPNRGRGGGGLRRGWCGRAGLRGRAGSRRL